MRKQKKKKTTSIFFDLVEIEEDEWWKERFIQMGEGYFPNHLNFSNSSLYYKIKGSYKIFLFDPNVELNEILFNLKKFLREVIGLVPDTEVSNYYTKNLPEINLEVLKRKPVIRDLLVWNYLSKLNLSKKEYKEKEREIFWGFISEEWTDKTFTIENNQIIDFDENERCNGKKFKEIENNYVKNALNKNTC